jgi:hypothetical protein
MAIVELRETDRPAVARLAALRAPAAVGALALGVTAVAAWHDPYRSGAYLGCPFYLLTGLYCPICGSTRALYDLAHLNLSAAWGMNPLFVLVVPLLVVTWLRWGVRSWRSVAGSGFRPLSPRRALVGLVVLVVFGILRNVPVLAPWLAP